jgi:predicted nucleic acid-binding protein
MRTCFWQPTLSIKVEQGPSAVTAIRDGTAAAMRYGLTAYDAAYVDLASREGLTLATLDNAMRKAAEESHVTIFARQ